LFQQPFTTLSFQYVALALEGMMERGLGSSVAVIAGALGGGIIGRSALPPNPSSTLTTGRIRFLLNIAARSELCFSILTIRWLPENASRRRQTRAACRAWYALRRQRSRSDQTLAVFL
jgi:hypothetical protein